MSIKDKYIDTICEINDIMTQIEKERVYEKTNWTQDGFLATNVNKLRKQMNKLLTQIQKNEMNISEPDKNIFVSNSKLK